MNQDARDLVEAIHREAAQRAEKSSARPAERAAVPYTELPDAPAASPLYREWKTYRRIVGQLLQEGHGGRHVLIKEEAMVGLFDSHASAMAAGYERFGLQPFLVHQVQAREAVVRLRSHRPWPR